MPPVMLARRPGIANLSAMTADLMPYLQMAAGGHVHLRGAGLDALTNKSGLYSNDELSRDVLLPG